MLRPIVLFQILAVAKAAAPFTSGFPPPPADWAVQTIPPPSGNALCNPIYNQTYGTQNGQNSSGYWNYYVSTPAGGVSPSYTGGLVDPTKFYQSSGSGAAYGGVFAQSVPYNARLLSTTDLFTLSGEVCSFIPDYVEDTFSNPDLNLYYWLPTGSYPYNIPNTNVPGNISTYNPIYATTGNYNYKTSSNIYTPWYNPNVPYANVAPGQGNTPLYGSPAGVVTGAFFHSFIEASYLYHFLTPRTCPFICRSLSVCRCRGCCRPGRVHLSPAWKSGHQRRPFQIRIQTH